MTRWAGLAGCWLATCGPLWHRGPAPNETFARFQLAAISLIFLDFHNFYRFSCHFMRFHPVKNGPFEKYLFRSFFFCFVRAQLICSCICVAMKKMIGGLKARNQTTNPKREIPNER